MNLLHRLYLEEDGQGLVEYTLVVLLVALVFWMGVRNTNVGDSLHRFRVARKSNPIRGTAFNETLAFFGAEESVQSHGFIRH